LAPFADNNSRQEEEHMSLLSIGKSGLYAAQAALSTTGHNITNSNVAGYSRQVVVQETSIAMGSGSGYIGTGTQIAQVKRYSDEFLNAQVRTAQASTSGLEAYEAQVTQIDNLLADTTSGLSPALQDFFSAVQNLTGDRAGVPSRGALLTSAETLAARFQSMNGRLDEIRKGVNTQITSSVNLVNTYASQIAELNDQIGKLSGGDNLNPPNDLLDQRDQLIMELNKQVKATVMPGDNNMLTVSIGNGQPLVVGARLLRAGGHEFGHRPDPRHGRLRHRRQAVAAAGERADRRRPGRRAGIPQQVAGPGPELAGPHRAGPGPDLQRPAPPGPGRTAIRAPTSSPWRRPRSPRTSTTTRPAPPISATVSDATQLTTSDYKVDYDGTNYNVTRLSDNKKTVISPFPQTDAADHRRPGLLGQRRGRRRRQLPGAPDHQRRRRPEAGADRRLAGRGRRADRHQRPADQQGHRQDQRRLGRQELPGGAAQQPGEPGV
jgi:flagellar hook-associated protein 1 FlgK